jgi:hypothetical protein
VHLHSKINRNLEKRAKAKENAQNIKEQLLIFIYKLNVLYISGYVDNGFKRLP